ncbi:MAG TPA: hypothetical protein PK022_00020 [Syntrophales bacterium]|nr:hypothetical protein [Syntrophales bacterium]
MLKADFQKYLLKFKLPAATSRGTYILRESWFIRIYDTDPLHGFGLGECAPLPDLSPEYGDDYEKKLREFAGISVSMINGLPTVSPVVPPLKWVWKRRSGITTPRAASSFSTPDFAVA